MSNLFSYFKPTTHDIVWIIIFAACLLALCIWAQSFRKRQYNFIKGFHYFLILSAVLLVGCFAVIFGKGLNYGLDFTGGTILELGFSQPVTSVQLSQTITGINPQLLEPQVQMQEKAGAKEQKVLIRIGKHNAAGAKNTSVQLQNEEVNTLLAQLEAKYGKIERYKVESIGPVVGGELRTKAFKGILLALLFQLIYITVRFSNRVSFGLAADIALAHDLVIMVGIYAIAGRQVDSPFLAALLTVIGYSVMDSIVIFDRIRENFRVIKKATFDEIVNVSLNQTMTRSINTLMTVLLTLAALYFFGGPTLKNFAFALLVGCTSGAYSSIFVAPPILVALDHWQKKQEERRVLTRRAALATAAAARSEKMAEHQAARAARAKGNPAETDYPSVQEVSGLAGSTRKSSASRPRRVRPRGKRA